MTEAFHLDSIEQPETDSTQAPLQLITELTKISDGERVLAALREGASWCRDHRNIEANGGRPRNYRAVPLAGSTALKAIS